MRTQFPILFQYEFDALLEALRRDLRAEQLRQVTDPGYADCHYFNARMSKKLLEILAPRCHRGERRLWALRHAVAQPVGEIAAGCAVPESETERDEADAA